MNELHRAVRIAGSRANLARHAGVSSQLIAWWIDNRNGCVPPHHASKIEAGVRSAIAADPEAAARARKAGSPVRVEKLTADDKSIHWFRDPNGIVIGWFTRDPLAPKRAKARAA